MNSNGANRVNLTNDEGWDKHPRWSPDAMEIVFESDRNGDWEIFVMNADGSGRVKLADLPGSSTGFLSWSPDETKIAFQSDIGEVLDMDVFVVNVDGTHPVNLSNHRGWDAGPWRSPDGSQILFNTVRDGNFEIYSMNVDGSNPLDLTNHPADDNSGTWLDTSPTLVSPEDKLIMTWRQVKHGNR